MLKKLPNMITVLRLLLVPLFVASFFGDYENKKNVYLFIFALSGLSDVIDGYLARKLQCESNFGKLVDPLADKLMQISVAVCVATEMPQLTWVPVFLAVKELFMICAAAGLLKKDNIVVKSNWAGKLATVVYFFAFLCLMIFDNSISKALAQCLCGLFAVFSLLALVIYVCKYIRESKNAKSNRRKVS